MPKNKIDKIIVFGCSYSKGTELVQKYQKEIVKWAKEKFDERLNNIDWDNYYMDHPFNPSALTLYKWAPIADELKTLDRKIVLNSMILKWNNIEKEFKKLINF